MKSFGYTHIIFLAIFTLLASCRSYRTIKPEIINTLINDESIEEFDMSEFELYTFNICELYGERFSGTDRFVECPDNFHEISEQKSIKKVEELYFLKHLNSNLVLYFTTKSHRFIRPQKGFLNSREIYDSYYYIDDIEYIYVAETSRNTDSLIFKSQKRKPDMTWLIPPEYDGHNFEIRNMYVSTIKNRNSDDKKIELNDVFSIPFKFSLSQLVLYDKTDLNKRTVISKIYLNKSVDSKAEVIFLNKNNLGYRFPWRKVRYYPNGSK